MFAAQRNMDIHAYSQKHALAAPSLFASHRLPHSCGALRW
jgi:hypothetical protein